MNTALCTKCVKLKPEDSLVEYEDEVVCPACLKMLASLAEIRKRQQSQPAPSERRRASGKATADAPRKPPQRPTRGERSPNAPRPLTADELADVDRDGRQWYAVAVYGGDRKAVRTIKDYMHRKTKYKVRVLVPREYQEVVVGGKVVRQYRRSTPGYLIVRIREDGLDDLKRCPQVGTVLPYAEPVADADEWERLAEEGELPPEPIPLGAHEVKKYLRKGAPPVEGKPQVGDRVRVRAGQWEGSEGEVTEVTETAVEFKVSILGMPAKLYEPYTNVYRLAPEE